MKHSILLNLVPGNAPNQYQGSNWGGQDGIPQASGYGGRNGNQGGMNSYNGNQGGGGGFRGSQSGGGYNNNNRRFNNRDQPMHAPGGTRFDSRFENERDRYVLVFHSRVCSQFSESKIVTATRPKIF